MIDEEYDYDLDMEAREEMAADRAASVTAARIAQMMLINGEDATKVAMYTTIPLDQVQQMSESLQGQ